MSQYVIRILEDILPAGDAYALAAAIPRAFYIAAGTVTVDGDKLSADDGIVSTQEVSLKAGTEGCCLWRWEVIRADVQSPSIGTRSTPRAEGPVNFESLTNRQLLRLDSVAFGPGGCAFLHTHRGPGIRCVKEGTIRIDSEGHSTSYGPGSPWFEIGPEPVFAQADYEIPTRFIRASVLPQELLGVSSIRYVNEEDKDKPKSQTYRGYGEKPFVI